MRYGALRVTPLEKMQEKTLNDNPYLSVAIQNKHKSQQDMANVQIKSEKLTPFGGIFSIMEQFDSMLSPIIDQTLGQRCRSIIG